MNETQTLPAASQAAAPLNYGDPEIISTLKQTVARGTTDAEFALFVQQCKATGLNPFKREIWCIKTQQNLQLMTGLNGYYEIANRHPQFDGIEVETIEEGGKLIKAVARVYRKDRSRPTTAEAYLAEYGKAYGNWKTMPRVMLSKCAESMALRKSFPQELNGLYTDAEMPREYAVEPQAEVKPPPAPANGTPRAMPGNERIEADELPDLYRIEAASRQYKGHNLAEIHRTNPAWLKNVVADPAKLARYTPRDQVNILAYAEIMLAKQDAADALAGQVESLNARAACEAALGGDEMPTGGSWGPAEQAEATAAANKLLDQRGAK